VPFLHFFDGFRTSHEVAKIEPLLDDDDLRAMIDDELVAAHRARALTPDAPGAARHGAEPRRLLPGARGLQPFYDACARHRAAAMDAVRARTGRATAVRLPAHPQAERVVVMMGSGAETAHETVEYLNAARRKVGVLKVRLFRPFAARFVAACRDGARIAVLDRTKEPGAVGEPLYQDVITALRGPMQGRRWTARDAQGHRRALRPVVQGVHAGHGQGGLRRSWRPSRPKRPLHVGIVDDVTHLSLPTTTRFDIEPDDVVRAVFFGLGADGTVGANKNSIKIIGEETDALRAGLLRLRLQEVRRDHRLAPALRQNPIRAPT
jgi:pyruvate-ferredoxin/flavodoxin oxidoreductase